MKTFTVDFMLSTSPSRIQFDNTLFYLVNSIYILRYRTRITVCYNDILAYRSARSTP